MHEKNANVMKRIFNLKNSLKENLKSLSPKGQIAVIGHATFFLELSDDYIDNCQFKGIDTILHV